MLHSIGEILGVHLEVIQGQRWRSNAEHSKWTTNNGPKQGRYPQHSLWISLYQRKLRLLPWPRNTTSTSRQQAQMPPTPPPPHATPTHPHPHPHNHHPPPHPPPPPPPTPHGFRERLSTETQLIQAVYDWASVVDAKQTDVVFLDFNKAFDTVPHTRLLKKLHHCGISDKTNDWISALLRGRRQRVSINGTGPTWSSVLSGVPQGTVIEPILFLIISTTSQLVLTPIWDSLLTTA